MLLTVCWPLPQFTNAGNDDDDGSGGDDDDGWATVAWVAISEFHSSGGWANWLWCDSLAVAVVVVLGGRPLTSG